MSATTTPTALLHALIPQPMTITPATDGLFTFTSGTQILADTANKDAAAVAQFLAERLRPAMGFPLPVNPNTTSRPAGTNFIALELSGADAALGDEGYLLQVMPDRIMLRSNGAAGLFYGVQTIRQLLPAAIDRPAVQSATWQVAASTIRDTPRFGWRGAMLDVSRHFFHVADVKHYIDLLAYYKLNRLHLHLSDDQGWRIAINAWPKLTTYSGGTAVNGDPGGYYTQADYSAIVTYAQQRYMTIVPEIDMPGHSNAALAAYAELNCDGVAPARYTGTRVGFSSLCVPKDVTYRFIDDVIAEIAALTPGLYIHVGGDESAATWPADYVHFVERVQAIVEAHGKIMVGWEEISQARLLPSALVQHWKDDMVLQAVKQGVQVIMSPAAHAYLDMKYDSTTALGLDWAGYVDVQKAYDWEPTAEIAGVGASSVIGVEGALWTETVRTLMDIEQLAFPRLIGIADIGWSKATDHHWDEYKTRLAAQGARLDALGVNFYRAPQVDWH